MAPHSETGSPTVRNRARRSLTIAVLMKPPILSCTRHRPPCRYRGHQRGFEEHLRPMMIRQCLVRAERAMPLLLGPSFEPPATATAKSTPSPPAPSKTASPKSPLRKIGRSICYYQLPTIGLCLCRTKHGTPVLSRDRAWLGVCEAPPRPRSGKSSALPQGVLVRGHGRTRRFDEVIEPSEIEGMAHAGFQRGNVLPGHGN